MLSRRRVGLTRKIRASTPCSFIMRTGTVRDVIAVTSTFPQSEVDRPRTSSPPPPNVSVRIAAETCRRSGGTAVRGERPSVSTAVPERTFSGRRSAPPHPSRGSRTSGEPVRGPPAFARATRSGPGAARRVRRARPAEGPSGRPPRGEAPIRWPPLAQPARPVLSAPRARSGYVPPSAPRTLPRLVPPSQHRPRRGPRRRQRDLLGVLRRRAIVRSPAPSRPGDRGGRPLEPTRAELDATTATTTPLTSASKAHVL